MDKHDLLKEVDRLDIGVVPVVRVHFTMRYQHEPLAKIATIDIPLDTGVAGLGGPQIRGNFSKSYFLQRDLFLLDSACRRTETESWTMWKSLCSII